MRTSTPFASLFILPLLIGAGAPLALADTASSQDGAAQGPIGLGQVRKGGKRLRADSTETKKPDAKIIRGHCSIVESATNPIAGPCVDILLILNDDKGSEVTRTRTNSKGFFEFSVEDSGTNYQIASGSKYYELIAPNGFLQGGAQIAIKLQQK